VTVPATSTPGLVQYLVPGSTVISGCFAYLSGHLPGKPECCYVSADVFCKRVALNLNSSRTAVVEDVGAVDGSRPH
jgi:hypothetical protein